jgi:hypothetical protein
LIGAERIRSIARDEKMGAATVEKDYALTWLLKGFYLKGSQLRNRVHPIPRPAQPSKQNQARHIAF